MSLETLDTRCRGIGVSEPRRCTGASRSPESSLPRMIWEWPRFTRRSRLLASSSSHIPRASSTWAAVPAPRCGSSPRWASTRRASRPHAPPFVRARSRISSGVTTFVVRSTSSDASISCGASRWRSTFTPITSALSSTACVVSLTSSRYPPLRRARAERAISTNSRNRTGRRSLPNAVTNCIPRGRPRCRGFPSFIRRT